MSDYLYRKLESLRTNVWYWSGLYAQADATKARDLQEKVQSAKELLKAFKRDNMPYLLEQPKLLNYKPQSRISDWTENFEEYGN